jgi:hypothetical protein
MTRESESWSHSIACGLLYWLILLACVYLPWVAHFTVGWWAGLPVFFVMAAVYDRLCVPKGSICMGVPLGLALGSFLALGVFDVALLLRWLIDWA